MSYFTAILRERYFYILLASIPFIIGIAGGLALLSSSYTGIHYTHQDNKLFIESVDPHSPASHYSNAVGAEVVSIGGWLPAEHLTDKGRWEAWTEYRAEMQYFSTHIISGKELNIIINKNGLDSTVRIRPISPNISNVAALVWGSYLIAACFIIISTIVVVKKPDKLQARVFYLLSFGVSVTYITETILLYILDKGLVAPYYLMIWGIGIPGFIGAAILPAAILHFCLVFPREDISAFISRGVIIPAYIISVSLVILTVLTTKYYIYLALLFIYIIPGFIILTYKYFKRSSPTERTEIMLILLGIVAPVMLEAFFELPMIALIPFFIAFAITRYKLMDIETLFDNTLIYLAVLGAFAILDIAFIYLLSIGHIALIRPGDIWMMVVVIWFIILTYIPVRSFVTDRIKRLLKREIYNIDKVMIDFQSKLLRVNDTQDVTRILIDTVEETLHPIRIKLHSSSAAGIQRSDGSMQIPIGNTGVFELGNKHSGNRYTKKDISLLGVLCDMASVVIKAIDEREKAKREREAIAREIHDNIGHSFVMAKYAMADTDNKPELKYIIDNGLAELREILAFTEGEEQPLGDFIEHIDQRINYFRENSKFRIGITTQTEDESRQISYQIRSNLLKIIQEAISNAVKYSGGDEITIEMIQRGESLSVSIRDNGKGFDVSQEIPPQHYGLRNMSQRAQIIGGELILTSRPRDGTQIRVDVMMNTLKRDN